MVVQLLLFSFCSQAKKPQRNMIDELNISHVSLSIMTAIRVDCKSFDSYFKGSIVRKKITSKENIDEFLSLIEQLKETDENYYPEPDTRIKIETLSEGEVKEIICIDNLVLKYKGKSYVFSEDLRQLILAKLMWV